MSWNAAVRLLSSPANTTCRRGIPAHRWKDSAAAAVRAGLSFSSGSDRDQAGPATNAAGFSAGIAAGSAEPAVAGCRLVVSEDARYDDILQIGGTPEISQELWENLPAMNWVGKGVQASHAADVLVSAQYTGGRETGDASLAAETEEQPVVVKAYAGLGKVLYLGSDSFWRWRYRPDGPITTGSGARSCSGRRPDAQPGQTGT